MTHDQHAAESGGDDRAYWIATLSKISRPVLTALAERRLRTSMPVETKYGDVDRQDRSQCTHLEAMARLLVGIAPWLDAALPEGAEENLRSSLAELARAAIDSATDPSSPDCMNFGKRTPGPLDHGLVQPLVDTAFLAQAILRAPSELWAKLPPQVKVRVANSLKESRAIAPGFNNWLLFSAVVEAALATIDESWDPMRVDYAIRQHESWYVGDGAYGDGPSYHWDYYNSFVIQPMILDILRVTDLGESGRFGLTYGVALARAQRYAAVLERMISPEGAIPPIGRSLAYRMGALQSLGQIALLGNLPAGLEPPQVRCAMTAVMRRLMEAEGTFDDGWLRIGFCGSQPALGEGYISTGSLYLCSVGLLPLGLPPSDPFWTAPYAPWTSRRIYTGGNIAADHAL